VGDHLAFPGAVRFDGGMRTLARVRVFVFSVFVFLALLLTAIPSSVQAADLVYVGTYTRETSKGIYAFRFDAASGKLETLGLVAEIENPSFVAVHPNQRFLYAVGETDGGSVTSYSIDRQSGKLTALNTVSAKGGGPCHVNLDSTGSSLAIANYGTGSVTMYPVQSDGRLGEASAFDQHEGSSVNPRRQQGPHAHSVDFSPDNRFLMSSDLGLDQVLIYRFDPKSSSITANDPPFARVKPGAGPRHFAFHPSARFAYVINEIASTVTAFSYDAARGALTELQTLSTLPQGYDGRNSTAEIEMHPSGKFVYGSNRGHHSIAVFAIDQQKGTLTLVENVSTQGETPRNFAIDPSGKFLFAANQQTDNIVLFRIDGETGKLAPTGASVEVDAPVCIRFASGS
jgi:6-phosphogluconolactonase